MFHMGFGAHMFDLIYTLEEGFVSHETFKEYYNLFLFVTQLNKDGQIVL